ncbi:MAG TPA: NADH-quinone oxidoreductase subunit C [Acidimicrobiales bacterium]|nr:NADH-quinone oxidoreductase subunit C [Acidimicrobiales bacterium]
MSDTSAIPDTTAPAEPELVHGCPVADSHGQRVVFVPRDRYLEVMGALSDEGFRMCVDLCGVDYLTHGGRVLPDGVEPERFEVVVNLVAYEPPRRVRVRVQVPEGDPVVPSLFSLWPGTEAYERETWDMLGIAFDGHPDLTRILMPEDWEGHPLRKDYPIGRVPVQFKAPREGAR